MPFFYTSIYTFERLNRNSAAFRSGGRGYDTGIRYTASVTMGAVKCIRQM